MTICALKVCRNYKGRLKTTKKVTYHRIPKDPIIRSRWIEIIRKSRGEDLWQPAKTTVICSDHFRAKDLYFANHQSRQRLKKEAIPRKALFLTSLETDDDESDDFLEETGKISDRVTDVLDDAQISGSNEEEYVHVTKDTNNSSNITDIKSGSTSSRISGQATCSKIGDGRKKENESDIIEDFSDLESIFISQDHIELFFGAIRMHGGYNDNPNARQLKGIYKKLLCHMELKSASSGNCVPLENISILMCSSSLQCINATVPSLRKDDDDEDEIENIAKNVNEHEDSKFRLLDDSLFSEYIQQIVGYVAGFVVRYLCKQIKCAACIQSLMSNEPLQYHKLVKMRDEVGLIYASHDVYSVCKTAENVIRKFIKQDFIMTPINYAKVVSTVMKQFVGGSNYFEVKTDHVCGLLHQVNLMRLVVEKYLDLRYYHKTKLDNINRDVTSKRKLFKKQIQREGH